MTDDTKPTGEAAMDNTQALARAFQTRPVAAATPECVADAEIYAAATGQLSADATATVIDHVTRCAACAQSWQLAAGLEQPNGSAQGTVVPFKRPAAAASPARPGALLSRGPVLAAAATVVLAVALVVVNTDVADPGDAGVYRGGPVLDGAEHRPAFEAADNTLHFRWALPAGDDEAMAPQSYTLVLFDSALNVVHRATSTDGSFALPRSAVPELSDPFFLQIEVVLGNGETLRSEAMTGALTE